MSKIEKADSAKLNFNSSGIFLCRITPDIAKAWLERNTSNRLINWSWVRTIAAMMVRGEWRDDHPSEIIFDNNHVLLDGQHRLLAVIEAGGTYWMKVTTGADPSLREYLDTGRVRTLGERKTFTQNLNANRVCAMIVRAMSVARTGQNSTPSPELAEHLFQLMPDAIVWSASNYSRTGRGLCRAGTMLAFAEFRHRCPALAQRCWDSYINADGVVQQGRMLRDWMLRSPAGSNSIADDYERCLAAMVSAFDGREIQLVRRVAKWPEYVTERAGVA